MTPINYINRLPDVILEEVFSFFSASDLMGVTEQNEKEDGEDYHDLRNVSAAISIRGDKNQLSLVCKLFCNIIKGMKDIDIEKNIQLKFLRNHFIDVSKRAESCWRFSDFNFQPLIIKDSIPTWVYRSKFHKDLSFVVLNSDFILEDLKLTLNEKNMKYLPKELPIDLDKKITRPLCSELRYIFERSIPKSEVMHTLERNIDDLEDIRLLVEEDDHTVNENPVNEHPIDENEGRNQNLDNLLTTYGRVPRFRNRVQNNSCCTIL